MPMDPLSDVLFAALVAQPFMCGGWDMGGAWSIKLQKA